MDVELISITQEKVKASILKADDNDLESLSKSWKFNWLELNKTKNTQIFKIETIKIEGLIKLQFVDLDFFEMKHIEVAPTNYGSKGKFINVAELLISYACLLSFKLNKGNYRGYLTFISKGKLIDYYINKYQAELIFRERMIINPSNGIKLIRKHLNIEL